MENDTTSLTEYFIPYKSSQLYIKYFKTQNNAIQPTTILIVHWMDVRGHKGNNIYDKIGNFFASKGITVFLFDVLGSGRSKGNFEFPQEQKDQITTVCTHMLQKLESDYGLNQWQILPIVHSISAVAIMCAINDGLSIKRLIWLGGPPSHANSIKRDIQSRGRFTWLLYRIVARIDVISGLLGFPITRKLFGFRLRVKDMYRSFSRAHGAKMMLSHKEMEILAVFGTKDEYLVLTDIDKEFPEEQSKHVQKIIIDGANHSFENHIHELLLILNAFVTKKE